jgi:hypothetical protein
MYRKSPANPCNVGWVMDFRLYKFAHYLVVLQTPDVCLTGWNTLDTVVNQFNNTARFPDLILWQKFPSAYNGCRISTLRWWHATNINHFQLQAGDRVRFWCSADCWISVSFSVAIAVKCPPLHVICSARLKIYNCPIGQNNERLACRIPQGNARAGYWATAAEWWKNSGAIDLANLNLCPM